jgi:hypothetical protein
MPARAYDGGDHAKAVVCIIVSVSFEKEEKRQGGEKKGGERARARERERREKEER